jgi:uncharacterized flavoprotein (TIGR03862 family)
MAAEILSAAGHPVDVYERMPSVARKFLMAGRGGLNLTHSEPFEVFVARYGPEADWLRPMLEAFTPADLRNWADALGAETFTGSSGRVFPKALKASPLLRAWLARLADQGVRIHTRYDWRGFDDEGRLVFTTPDGEKNVAFERALLALGGASWPRLGGDGGWAQWLSERGVAMAPFQPANMGFRVDWSDYLRDRFAGTPLKNIALSFGGHTVRGEIIITNDGIEGGAVYALSRILREDIIRQGSALLSLDLKPDQSIFAIEKKLQATDLKASLSTRLRKAFNLPPVAIALLNEDESHADLSHKIKALPVRLTGTQNLERAISSAGGIRREAVDSDLQLKALPGIYVAGEMLDWEAPTGGYLLQASFASAVHAAREILSRSA